MANRKLFGTEIGLTTDPATTKRIAVGDTSTTVLNMTMGALRTWILNAIPPPALLTKVVNIGSYNMTNGAAKEISLGVALSKIRGIEINIWSDDGGIYPLYYPHSNWELSATWRVLTTPTTNAKLRISTNDGRFFDQSAFNSTSINRGYIIVTYVA